VLSQLVASMWNCLTCCWLPPDEEVTPYSVIQMGRLKRLRTDVT